MARKREIHPDVLRHEGMIDAEARTGLPIRLAYIALWTVADREGRFRWRPRRLRAESMPLDTLDMDAVLAELLQLKSVWRYGADGEHGCMPPRTWAKYQHPHPKEVASEIPAPPDVGDRSRSDLGQIQGGSFQAGSSEPSGSSEASATVRKPRKSVLEQAGLIGDLARQWSEAHATPDAPKPLPSWSGEAARVIALSKEHGESDVRRRWTHWLACSCPFSQGHPLKTFSSSAVFDQMLAPCRRCAPKRDVDGDARRSLGRRTTLIPDPPCAACGCAASVHRGAPGRIDAIPCVQCGGCRDYVAASAQQEVSR